jgi:signal transduction histidine kinase
LTVGEPVTNTNRLRLTLARYGLAVVATGAATVVRMLLEPIVGPQSPFILFILSGAVVAWSGGLGPGLLAFLLGWVMGAWLFAPELMSHPFLDAPTASRTILYALVGVVISAMAETLHRALRLAREREQAAYAEASARALANARLDLLASSATELLRSAEPKAIVDELCRKVMALLECDVFFNYLVVPGSGRLRLNASGGITADAARRAEWLEFDESVCGGVASRGERVIANDISKGTDSRLKLLQSGGVSAYVCHPLMAEGRVLGTLGFGTCTRTSFTADEVELMRSMADHVAIALQRQIGEEARRASEERYRAFVSTSHEAIWRIELDEPLDISLPVDEQMRLYFERAYYAEANDALAKLYGFEHAAEVTGLRVRDVESPDQPETLASLRAFMEGGYRMADEVSHERDRHGEPRYFFNNYVGIVEEGHLIRLWGSSLDITARHAFEEELARAKESAEAANRAKDAFLAALSHELRTPLSPVLLTASELRNEPTLTEGQKAEWDMVYRNISLQARLVDDLLDLTRIVRGKLSLNLRRLDAHRVMKDALVTVGPDLEAKRHQLTLNLAAGRTEMDGDETRLQQVFWNILKNAVKFTPEGGKISVSSMNPDGNGTLRIAIEDSGIGLGPEETGRIFEAFVQGEHASGSTAHRFGGMGLGLAISRQLVEMHRGRIWAESVGRECGTTFYVEFPLDEAPV